MALKYELDTINYKIRQKQTCGLVSQSRSICHAPWQCRNDVKTKLGRRRGWEVEGQSQFANCLTYKNRKTIKVITGDKSWVRNIKIPYRINGYYWPRLGDRGGRSTKTNKRTNTYTWNMW